MHFGQVNPYAAVTEERAGRPQDYVDIVDVSAPVQVLTGMTLGRLEPGGGDTYAQVLARKLGRRLATPGVRQWLSKVQASLLAHVERRASRNMPPPFLAHDSSSPLGLQGLHGALPSWLAEHHSEKASPDQWCQRIRNLAGRGLREEELVFSRLEENVSSLDERTVTGDAVASCLDYSAVRISIVPVVSVAGTQLSFSRIDPGAEVKRLKPRLPGGLASQPEWRDHVLGYWIDRVEWSDLLGSSRAWVVLTHRGEPVTGPEAPAGVCPSLASAKKLAAQHARTSFPKMSTKGHWSTYRLTGGENYREWLVTLPYFASGYFSSHFDHRNILLHVRCDMREGAAGERVLVLQEVQSDWAQEARRYRQGDDIEDVPTPPWAHEWPSLALKLMLLHAAQSGLDMLAWTTGSVQAERYGGFGKDGLLELYDRTLPSELNRLLAPYKRQCGTVEVFQPTNFRIEPADIGYEVWDAAEQCLGTAATWEEAQALLPDGTHEELRPMHGVRIDKLLKSAILAHGFHAWGWGIRED